uniref:EGF-like domain-containing protein n=1 Tax=Romanomermis culicivorax TaxID=13658 RepID=A0A915HUU7_ROMCU
MDNGSGSAEADFVPMHRPCTGHFSDFCLNGVCRVEPASGIFYCNCTPPYEGKRCEYFSLRVTGSAKWWSLGQSQWVGFTIFGLVGILFLSCIVYYTVIRKRNFRKKNRVRRRTNTDSWLTMCYDANNNQIWKLSDRKTMETCTLKVQYDDVEQNEGRSSGQSFVVAVDQNANFPSPPQKLVHISQDVSLYDQRVQ